MRAYSVIDISFPDDLPRQISSNLQTLDMHVCWVCVSAARLEASRRAAAGGDDSLSSPPPTLAPFGAGSASAAGAQLGADGLPLKAKKKRKKKDMKKDGSGAAGVAVGLYDVMTDKLEKPGMVVFLLLVNRQTFTLCFSVLALAAQPCYVSESTHPYFVLA